MVKKSTKPSGILPHLILIFCMIQISKTTPQNDHNLITPISTRSNLDLNSTENSRNMKKTRPLSERISMNSQSYRRKLKQYDYVNNTRKLKSQTIEVIHIKPTSWEEPTTNSPISVNNIQQDNDYHFYNSPYNGSEAWNVFVRKSSENSEDLGYNDVFDESVNQVLSIMKREALESEYEQNITAFNGSEFAHNSSVSDEEYLNQIKEFIFPKTWTWVLIFFHTAVFVIGLVGNTLVCVAVYRNHTMRTVTNYFIVNLAVADFLVILFCLPPSVIWDVTMTWFLGIAMCKIVLYLQTVSVTVSVLTLTFISVDRWYAICFPLKFKSTTGRAKTGIGFIWFIALMFDIPELVVFSAVRNQELQIDTIYFTQCEPSWSKDADTTWSVLKMILLYAVPLAFMSVAYCQIIRVLWKSGNVHQHSMDMSGTRQINSFTMNTNASTEGQLRSRRKAAKMLVSVVVMFAVCYFPVHLLSLLRLTVALSNSDTNRALALISHWLCYANSAVNPLIYNFMSGKFRKEFHRAFEHCCQPSANRQMGYQMTALHPKNTEKDSGIGGSRSHSRSSKRVTEIRRLNTIERPYPDRSRRLSEKTSVSKIDV